MGRDKDSSSGEQIAGDSKGRKQTTGNAPTSQTAVSNAFNAAAASSGKDQHETEAPVDPPLHDDDPSYAFHQPASHVDPR
jgi:hypothetical protein